MATNSTSAQKNAPAARNGCERCEQLKRTNTALLAAAERVNKALPADDLNWHHFLAGSSLNPDASAALDALRAAILAAKGDSNAR